jgi:hypothetical protein
MTLRELEDTGNGKRAHLITLYGELALKEAMVLS